MLIFSTLVTPWALEEMMSFKDSGAGRSSWFRTNLRKQRELFSIVLSGAVVSDMVKKEKTVMALTCYFQTRMK